MARPIIVLTTDCARCGKEFTYAVKGNKKRTKCQECWDRKAWETRTNYRRPSRAKEATCEI